MRRPRPHPFVVGGFLLLAVCAAPAGALAQKPQPLGSAGLSAGAKFPPTAPPAPPPAHADPATGPGTGAKPPPLLPGDGPFGRVPDGGGRDGEGGNRRRAASSGTGFVVAAGRVLTNDHVAQGCAEVRVRTAGGRELAATLAASDRDSDLALLAVQGDPGPPLPFRAGPELRRGEEVVTYGFPLAGLLSSGPTLTTGEVSALAGLRDDPRQFQISAPVQPGNSGGPLLDRSGNVVGIVVSKLNAQNVARRTGDIPQNVNFAIKGTQAVEFLRRIGVQPRLAQSAGRSRGAAEVGEAAHPSTVFLRCMR